MAKPNRVKAFKAGLEDLLADAFHSRAWRVHRSPSKGGVRSDLIVERGGKEYLVEFKRSSEGRSDRLIALLSQAILQAQAYARLYPGAGQDLEMLNASASRLARSHASEGVDRGGGSVSV